MYLYFLNFSYIYRKPINQQHIAALTSRRECPGECDSALQPLFTGIHFWLKCEEMGRKWDCFLRMWWADWVRGTPGAHFVLNDYDGYQQ
jgi:hypothetical protein